MESNIKSDEIRAVVGYQLYSKEGFFPKTIRQALHKIVSA